MVCGAVFVFDLRRVVVVKTLLKSILCAESFILRLKLSIALSTLKLFVTLSPLAKSTFKTSPATLEPFISRFTLDVLEFTFIVKLWVACEPSISIFTSFIVVGLSNPDVKTIFDAVIFVALKLVSPPFATTFKTFAPTLTFPPKSLICLTLISKLLSLTKFSKFITLVVLKSTTPLIFKVSPVAVFAPPSRTWFTSGLWFVSIYKVSSPSPKVTLLNEFAPPLRFIISSPTDVVSFSIDVTFVKSLRVLLTVPLKINSSTPLPPSILSFISKSACV